MNLQEVQPTLFFAVPRIWEKIHATILIKLNDATPMKRLFNAIGLKLAGYIGRLSHVLGVRDIEFHIDEVTGVDKTIDVVVDIFNRVNSGGPKLSKGDLALAKNASRPLRSRAQRNAQWTSCYDHRSRKAEDRSSYPPGL